MLRHEPWAMAPSTESDDRRLVILVDDLRGGDSDHAAMPAFPADDEHIVRADRRVGFDGLLRLRDEIRFLALAAQVFFVQLQRQAARLLDRRFVVGEEQTGRDVGRAHPSGRVDAGGENESDLVAVDPLAAQPGRFEQRAQSNGVAPAAQGSEPELGDDPVLADERDDVGECADRGNLDECREPPALAGALAERLHQLQGDPDAGEILVRIPAVGALRVDHRQGGRQCALRLVMIGDDEIDAELARAQGRLAGANAAVDRDDELHAFAMQAIDCRRLQAVTVAQPLGDEVHDVATEQLEGATQDDGRGDAVDVVVTVDGDALPAGQGPLDALDRARHVGEQERIVEVIEGRREETRRALGITQPAQAEQPRHGRVQIERLRQPPAVGVVARQVIPEERLHALGPGGAAGSWNPTSPMRRNFS